MYLSSPELIALTVALTLASTQPALALLACAKNQGRAYWVHLIGFRS
jgi:hypothetical protein